MNQTLKALALTAASIAVIATAASSASADTRWQNHHPRREQVNNRLANQNRRIRTERREGEITGAQAAELHAQDRGIRAQERYDASLNGGHITRSEQHQLNQDENQVSHEIGK